jgi:hypothetical protein
MSFKRFLQLNESLERAKELALELEEDFEIASIKPFEENRIICTIGGMHHVAWANGYLVKFKKSAPVKLLFIDEEGLVGARPHDLFTPNGFFTPNDLTGENLLAFDYESLRDWIEGFGDGR